MLCWVMFGWGVVEIGAFLSTLLEPVGFGVVLDLAGELSWGGGEGWKAWV